MAFHHITKADLMGDPPPVGVWPFRIERVVDRKSKAGNATILVSWKCSLTDPPGGTSLLDNFPLVENALWRLGDMLKATGYDLDGEGFDSKDLNGLEAKIFVGRETYQGVKRPRAKAYYSMDSDVEIGPREESAEPGQEEAEAD